MNKAILSVVALLAIMVGGYFVDDGYKAKVDGAFGRSAVTQPVARADVKASPVEVNPGGALQAIVSSGVVRVSVQSPSKPFFDNETGRAKGFNVDFLNLMLSQREFGGRAKLEPHAVDSYEKVPKQLLSTKDVDIAIDGLTFNDEDLPGVVYTVPYVKDFGYSLITAKGNTVTTAADLVGAKIGILKGDPDVRAFVEQAFPGAKIVEVSDKAGETGKFIVGQFKSRAVDAFVYDYPFAVAEVEGTDLQFAMTKIKGSDIQYRIGVRKGDTDLLAALNSAIRTAVDAPEYPELLKKYFMSDKVATVRRASSGEVAYVVVKGDNLGSIARTQLGDQKRYVEIQSRNNLANPNFISVGQKLIVPTK